MSALGNTFSRLQSQNKTAFIPYITAGNGGLDCSLAVLHKLVDAGADIIEIGIPFSDPMADGSIITASHEQAVMQGVNLCDVFTLVINFRKTNAQTPIVLMGYANPIEKFGYEAFANIAKTSGVSGVIIVDMPLEESASIKKHLTNAHIDLIFLISLTTTQERLQQFSTQVSGFAYLVALKGITGAKNLNLKQVKSKLTEIKQTLKIPIGVGFGIKDTETATQIASIADAVIVGSSLVSIITQYQDNQNIMLEKIYQVASQLAQAIKTGG